MFYLERKLILFVVGQCYNTLQFLLTAFVSLRIRVEFCSDIFIGFNYFIGVQLKCDGTR